MRENEIGVQLIGLIGVVEALRKSYLCVRSLTDVC